MNLRSKSIGLLAGVIFAVSSVTGVIAAEGDPITTLTLSDNPNGACTAAIEGHDFQDFTWTGSTYDGQLTGNFTITQSQSYRNGPVACSFQITGSSLTHEDGGSSGEILNTGINLTGTESNSTLSDTTTVTRSISGPSTTVTNSIVGYDLTNAIGTQPVGEYTGTITVTNIPARVGE